MNFRKILLASCFLSYSFLCTAQQVKTSVSQVISAKAAKGSLYNYNDEGDKIQLTYLLKESKKGLQVETYSFDKSSLKFLESKEETVAPTLFGKVGQETKGDKVLRVYPNLKGKAKIKLGYIQYTEYPRWTAQKFITTSEMDPKGDAGEKMYYVHHRTEEADANKVRVVGKKRTLNVGDVQLIGVMKSEPLFARFASLVISAKDLSTRAYENIEFDYSYMPICADNLPNGDIAVVFRSFTQKDFPKPNVSKSTQEKYSFAENYHLKYLQLNNDGEVVQNVNLDFHQPESGFTLHVDIVPTEDNQDVYIVATSKPLKLLANPLGRVGGPKPVYANEKNTYLGKCDQLFVGRVKDNKKVFAKTYTPDQFLHNLVLSEGAAAPKDVQAYMGKGGQKSAIPTSALSRNGKGFIAFKVANSSQHVMQLSETGDIEANYALSFPKNKIPQRDMEFYFGSGGEMYLFAYFQDAMKKDASEADWIAAAANRNALVVQLDPDGKKFSAPVNLTPGATLDLYDPFFFESKDSFVTLGNGRKKEIVLTRISL